MKTAGRAVIYELGGVYLLYLAYSIFQNRAASVGGEYVVIMIASVLFLLLGVGLVGFGLAIFYKTSRKK